jgi:hypothetical protein
MNVGDARCKFFKLISSREKNKHCARLAVGADEVATGSVLLVITRVESVSRILSGFISMPVNNPLIRIPRMGCPRKHTDGPIISKRYMQYGAGHTSASNGKQDEELSF